MYSNLADIYMKPYAASRGRTHPDTWQAVVTVNVRPEENLPEKRADSSETGSYEHHPYLRTSSAPTLAYKLARGELAFLDPQAQPATMYSFQTENSPICFTSFNNLTDAEADRIQFFGVVAGDFSYDSEFGGAGLEDRAVGCQIAGSVGILNTGPQDIPSGAKIFWDFPTKDNDRKDINGIPPSKILPVLRPMDAKSNDRRREQVIRDAVEHMKKFNSTARLSAADVSEYAKRRGLPRRYVELMFRAVRETSPVNAVKLFGQAEDVLRARMVGFCFRAAKPGDELGVVLCVG